MNGIERASSAKALLSTLLGRPGGSFTQYADVGSIDPVDQPYPKVEALLAASPWRDFLAAMATHVDAFRAFGPAPDPDWNLIWFGPLDGAAVYTAVKQFNPARVIEIGSGDSSFFLKKAGANLTCIDPQPRQSIEALGG